MIDVILAAPDLSHEPELVTSASGCGIRVLRRCVDAVDLLAAAAIDSGVLVVLSARLPRLSADVLARLGSGRRIIGLAVDPLDATTLDGMGVRLIVPVDATATGTWRSVRDTLLGVACDGAAPQAAPSGVWTTGVWAAPETAAATARSSGRSDGTLIAVWGPMGAPGRTTLAIGVAEALAATGRRVCLVDADTYAPSIGLALGMVDDAGGLVRACRQADNGCSTRRASSARHGAFVDSGTCSPACFAPSAGPSSARRHSTGYGRPCDRRSTSA